MLTDILRLGLLVSQSTLGRGGVHATAGDNSNPKPFIFWSTPMSHTLCTQVKYMYPLLNSRRLWDYERAKCGEVLRIYNSTLTIVAIYSHMTLVNLLNFVIQKDSHTYQIIMTSMLNRLADERIYA